MAPFPSPTSTWHTETYPSISPTRPELSAKGKSVLITGAGSGIGAETALYFATAGASRIALLGRREQPLLEVKASIEKQFSTVEVSAIPTDIGKRDQVEAAFAKFAGNGKGKIDVFLSNAASLGPLSSMIDLKGDELLEYIHQSFKGTLFVAQTFLKYAPTDAVVINTSSLAAHVNALSGIAAYSIAKVGIVRFWDYLIYENPEIKVFHVHPGVISTAMGREAGGIETLGQEDDVSLPASFNVWLASPEARFLKGKYVWANWDVDELKAKSKEIEESAQLSIGLVGWPFENVN
ncbi:hypothetical protein EYC80_009156 [Monilinia laxa]|uniref:Ketoreductase domain-containing protein n=1 Tax=Monilinia laxa TaxID=61186 RepID=A0A5N6K2S3_MONLA|nr:hypothetical protein EYC80_009156 [Monilinia laxa]